MAGCASAMAATETDSGLLYSGGPHIHFLGKLKKKLCFFPHGKLGGNFYTLRIHSYAKSLGLGEHPLVQTAVVAMYAKCGSLVESRHCFDSMRKRNLIAGNTLTTAYPSHGRRSECISTYEEMRVQPDSISFMGLLSGCSHSGLSLTV